MKVLINAGGGYVGQVLTRELLKKKYKVTVVDRFFIKTSHLLKNTRILRLLRMT